MLDNEQLEKGLHQLGIEPSGQTIDQLIRFSQLVIKWNNTHNLTSITRPQEFLVKHIFDSLSLLPTLQSTFQESSSKLPLKKLLDIGSGAGFPGIVLAIVDPSIQLTSVDASQKRIGFQKQVVRELDLENVLPLHSRIEDFNDQKFNAITGRAFSSIHQIVTSSQDLLSDKGCWLLMKGAVPQEEMDQFQRDLEFQDFATLVIPLEVPDLDAERHLIKIIRN